MRRMILLLLLLSATSVHAQASACAADEHRQFDFWLGNWDVYGVNGKLAGTNEITREYGGCVVHERYRTGSGYAGESLNVYDAGRKRWHQTWTDNGGMLLLLDGGLQGRDMVLEGESRDAAGIATRHRITWTPNDDGTVRQHWQNAIGTADWSTAFDGTYRPAVKTAATSYPRRVFDTSNYSQAVTDCDRRASHVSDPYKVGDGVETVQDLPAAIAACRASLARDPHNPRLQYQLARVLIYSGAVTEGMPWLESSLAQGYPQALFVAGYLLLEGRPGLTKDVCRAGELIRESALYGRLAGEVGFPAYVLQGRFDTCAVPRDRGEMLAMLETARARKPAYFETVLIDTLLHQLR